MAATHGDLFVPVDLKRRVFAKVAKTNLRYRLMLMAHQAEREQSMNHPVTNTANRNATHGGGPGRWQCAAQPFDFNELFLTSGGIPGLGGLELHCLITSCSEAGLCGALRSLRID